MLKFLDSEFKRIAVFKLNRKGPDEDHASVSKHANLMDLEEDTLYSIQNRLDTATSRQTKSFYLQIANTAPSSFFDIAKGLSLLPRSEFLTTSYSLALQMARTQKSSTIPGGYCIVIDGVRGEDLPFSLIIKAETHEAIKLVDEKLEVVKDIFLSPKQKLFKFGMIYKLDKLEQELLPQGVNPPNDEWGAFVYDEQFTLDSLPAKFFYSDFLGFDTSNNHKLQTRKFYDDTEKFIVERFDSSDDKVNLLSALNAELSSEDIKELAPIEFIEKYIPNEEVHQFYRDEVALNLPDMIRKDTTLIKAKLQRKTFVFPDKVKLSGPKYAVEDNIEIISNPQQANELNWEDDNFTLIKIKGKPFEEV